MMQYFQAITSSAMYKQAFQKLPREIIQRYTFTPAIKCHCIRGEGYNLSNFAPAKVMLRFRADTLTIDNFVSHLQFELTAHAAQIKFKSGESTGQPQFPLSSFNLGAP